MVLLSFDIEEFDMPVEYKKQIPFGEQMSISIRGTRIILSLLEKHGIKATFFCTANFANHANELVQEIALQGHEIASHGYYHTGFEQSHLLDSRLALEQISHTKVEGFRMPRMMPVDDAALLNAGYTYNTSINPTYIPGRYNNLKSPRRYFQQNGVLQIPASVSPTLRIPLFWLSFHNFPLPYFKFLCRRSYQKDGYLNLYFHPWEFTDISDKQKFGFPGYISRNSGNKMTLRLDNLISWMKTCNYSFGTFNQFIATTTHPSIT